jgi:hypothetical protein
MLYNELKKGHAILANGFKATMYDNKKGAVRMVEILSNVNGMPEIGSCYISGITDRDGKPFEMSKAQEKTMKAIRGAGF